jgi:xylan 1,4-beta-xylosidase
MTGDRFGKEERHSFFAYVLFGILAASLATVVFAVSGQSPEWVGFDSFTYRGVDAVYEKQSPETEEYHNPILAGFYPDPSICRSGRDYYLVNSTFAYFPGIPIFHSRDLVNWEQVGHVIRRPEQLRYDGLGISRGIFAPAITWHDGVFYVVCTMVDGGGNFVVTAIDPAGPWSDPVYLQFEGIDPSLFFDDGGRAWMVNNGAPDEAPRYNGHRAIWIQEFDPVEKKIIGPRKVIVNGGVDISQRPIWIEGPHIFKRNGWYYLCCAEGGTESGHSQVIFRSRKVDGPYTPWYKNPILTQRDLSPDVADAVTCTGHADLEVGPDGTWWAVFLGVRPYDGNSSPMGRETFLLPVTWTGDDWPVILPPGERVPLTVKIPQGVTARRSNTIPLNGSFTWTDDFRSGKLSPVWIMLRAPKETWWKLDPASEQLKLAPGPESLAGRGNPSYLARRIQHDTFTAETVVDIPNDPGVSAGLALFQGERYHYFLAVKRDGGRARIYLERARGEEPEQLETAALSAVDKVRLSVEADKAKCSFKYMGEEGTWKILVDNADAAMLTTAVAGGFVGATVGPHVRLDP